MFTKLLDTLRAALGRKKFESDLDAELADHIAKYTDDLIAQGVPPDEARHRARLEFGAVEQIKDEVRDSHAVTFVDSGSRQLRFAFRALGRSPVFSLTAIVTLAVGIGATTAGFSVVNAVLLRDLPYPDPDRIYRLFTMTPEGKPEGWVAPHDMPTLYTDHPSVEAGAHGFGVAGRLIDPEGAAHNLDAYYVTDQYFKVFAVPLFLGEGFKPENRTPQMILAYSTWRDLFASDPQVIGKRVTAESGPQVVMGVASPGFTMPANAKYWSLLYRGVEFLRAYDGYIRLKPTATRTQFEEQLKVLSADLGPDPTSHRNVQFIVKPLLETIVRDLRSTVLILFGAASILLLIACINVANLMLSRGIQRTREMAIREALGAKRGHVIRTLWTEAFLLSAIGGTIGVFLGWAGVRLLMQIAPEGLPRLETVPMDAHVLLFGLAATLLTGLLTGLAPAIRIAHTDLRALINDGARGASATVAQHRVFGALVVSEIALAVILVIGAGLLYRSYVNLSTSDPGFNPNRLMTIAMQVNTPPAYKTEMDPNGRPRVTWASYEPIAAFYDQLIERIRAIPGVEQVTAGSSIPLRGNNLDVGGDEGAPRASAQLADKPVSDKTGAFPQVLQRSAYPDFFRVMGARIVNGRSLQETDARYAAGVAVVNEAYVKRFLPGENPLGKRINLPDGFYRLGKAGFQYGELTPDQVEIVGVVADIKYASLAAPVEPSIFLSNDQYTLRPYTVFVRSTGPQPEKLVPAIRAEIKEMDKALGATFTTYPTYLTRTLARQRMGTTLLVTFSAIALLLAAVGIYGLMSYSVAQRTQELAVRAAMGASSRDLRTLIVRRGLVLGVTGTVLGIIGAIALRKVVASQLYEVSALDPRVFLTVPAVLLAVAVLSSYIPALRASHADPAELLKSD